MPLEKLFKESKSESEIFDEVWCQENYLKQLDPFSAEYKYVQKDRQKNRERGRGQGNFPLPVVLKSPDIKLGLSGHSGHLQAKMIRK